MIRKKNKNYILIVYNLYYIVHFFYAIKIYLTTFTFTVFIITWVLTTFTTRSTS